MSLVARQLPALYNGVSQQPATTRLPSQAQAQVNGWATPVDGLSKRPPSDHVALLTAADLSSSYTHVINRDGDERYVVVMSDGAIRIFSLDGTERTVNYPGRLTRVALTSYPTRGTTVKPSVANGYLYGVKVSGTTASGAEPTWPTTLGATVVDGTVTWECVPDYLKVTDAQQDFSLVTVADFTFVLNKTVAVAMAEAGRDTYVPATDQWSITDSKKKKGAKATLISGLFPLLQQAVRGQYSARGTQVFKGVKQSVQDIPTSPAPVDGDVWQIQGTADSAFATYYVVRRGGVWEETVEPNIPNRILECTMPHALVRLADGTFEFNVFAWAPRRVGSETTNPNPAFVGRAIREAFFFKNRLGFCVDENVVLSRAGDFGNFYRLTVVDLLDDETIDVAATTTQVTKFNFAVPMNKALMLFSDQVQFVASDAGGLTPSSVSLDVATRYDMLDTVRPEALGTDVYFISESADYARVLEYFVRDDSNATDAADITAHVPRYIPKGVRALFGSGDNDVLCVISSGAANRLYIYKFYWTSGDEKAQSSWSYWEFGANDVLLDGAIIDSAIYLVIKRSNGTYIERIDLESGARAATLPVQVYLDRRVSLTGTWLAGEGKTQFTLPYPLADLTGVRIVRGPDFTTATGALVPTNLYEWVNSTTIKVLGNYSAGECYVGLSYTFRYTFSEQFIKNASDVPITMGRLQLRTWTVYFTGSAYFSTEVAPYGDDVDVEEVITAKIADFTGKTLGNTELTLGTPVVQDGSYAFQVYGNADVAVVSLVNSSHVASNFQSAEWEGFYQNRISRLV